MGPPKGGARDRTSLARGARLIDRESGFRIICRDLASRPPSLANEAFVEAIRVPLVRQSSEHREALEPSEALIAELEETDGLVIGAPMHSFTVPAVLKAWIEGTICRWLGAHLPVLGRGLALGLP